MDTSNGKEEPKMQEDDAGKGKCRKKEQEEGTGNSSTGSVNSRSGPDYQICIPLGWAPW
jgi:hypothetical protein